MQLKSMLTKVLIHVFFLLCIHVQKYDKVVSKTEMTLIISRTGTVGKETLVSSIQTLAFSVFKYVAK